MKISKQLYHNRCAKKIEDLFYSLSRTASLYLHWPFCQHICPYCNFNKYKSQNVDNKRMEKSLRREFKRQVNDYSIDSIKSVFFGGGTPSLCDVTTVENLINDVYRTCSIKEDLEITLEANPSNDHLAKLRSFKAAGINRVSIGVQALDDSDLVRLGRDHTVRDAIQYTEEANRLFDGRISIDLMFGRPGQTLKSWANELKMATELSKSHISLYQLTMERSTPMEKMHRRGEIVLPDQDEIGDMYHMAVQHLENTGLQRYEVANFAKEGYESRHNMAYWAGHQYIGVGPGAHGRIHQAKFGSMTRFSTVQTLVPDKWMNQIEKHGNGMIRMEKLQLLQTLEELLLHGLRAKTGVNQEVFSAFSNGIRLKDLEQFSPVKELIKDGFLDLNEKDLRATHKGLGLLDHIMPDICLALEDLLNKNST